jgi:hypothetical protein
LAQLAATLVKLVNGAPCLLAPCIQSLRGSKVAPHGKEPTILWLIIEVILDRAAHTLLLTRDLLDDTEFTWLLDQHVCRSD